MINKEGLAVNILSYVLCNEKATDDNRLLKLFDILYSSLLFNKCSATSFAQAPVYEFSETAFKYSFHEIHIAVFQFSNSLIIF